MTKAGVVDPVAPPSPARGGGAVARPVPASERIAALDALRGLAILGVLASYTLWNLGSPPPETWSGIDRVVNVAGEVLIDTKFLTIFAFLFGAGVSQQWRRAQAAGASVWALHARRMTFLLAVGLLHGALLRNGDILAPYAILGLVLFAISGSSSRALAVAAVVLAFLPYVNQIVLRAAEWSLAARPGPAAGNLDWLLFWYRTNPILSWPRILALMVAGVLAERTGLIARVAAERGLARAVLLSGLLLAIAGRGALMLVARQPATFTQGVVTNFTYHATAWSQAAAYAGGLALLCQREVWVERLGPLRAVGRMAFTNYLLQAVLIVPLCLALGLFDRVTPTVGLALAFGVASLQVPLSVRWLRRHRYGPLEALWRHVTYGPAN